MTADTIVELVGTLYGLCFLACYVPQLVRTLRKKSVDDLSLAMYWLCILGYALGITYMVLKDVFLWGLALNLFGGIVLAGWQTALIYKYRT